MRFSAFELPDISARVPPRFFVNRNPRLNYVRCLADFLGIPTPDVDTTPWYSLSNDIFVRPWGEACRAFGKSVLDHFISGPGCVTRNYLAVLMDAYPDVDWQPWRLGENSGARWTKVSIFVDGLTLPSPNHESVMDGEPKTISGREISRSFLRMVASVVGIPLDRWETGWNDITLAQIEADLRTEGRISGWEQFLSTGCPDRKSLYSALSCHFDDLGFTWWPWLVGGNVPNGWGNPTKVGEEVAREQLQNFLVWYVNYYFALNLHDNYDVLYDIGQRGIEQWHSVCKNSFNGSPQALIEFAFPNVDWDPTRFGNNHERQRFWYHVLRTSISEDELAEMNGQNNKGWEHRFEEFGLPPKIVLSDGRIAGGKKLAQADIWFDKERLFADVLGEDHFDENLSRSNNRSQKDTASRFEQRQSQDLWRWEQCWNAGYKTIAIGPELPLNDDGVATYVAAIEQARSIDGPCFIAIGWPEGVEAPIFGSD